MKDLLATYRRVKHRGNWLRQSDLPEPSRDSLTWNSIKRPTDPGLCLLRDCGRLATRDGLCWQHDLIYRVRCERCGKHVRQDIGIRRRHCGRCWATLPQERRLVILGDS